MRNRENIQDRSESELDIEEIDNSSAPRRLKSRPRELTKIDQEEGNETPSSRQGSGRTVPSRSRNNSAKMDDKIFQIAVVIILGILLCSNLLLIYQISSISHKQRDMGSNISLLINKSHDISNDFSSLKNIMSNSKMNSYALNNSDANHSAVKLPLNKVNTIKINIENANDIRNVTAQGISH